MLKNSKFQHLFQAALLFFQQSFFFSSLPLGSQLALAAVAPAAAAAAPTAAPTAAAVVAAVAAGFKHAQLCCDVVAYWLGGRVGIRSTCTRVET